MSKLNIIAGQVPGRKIIKRIASHDRLPAFYGVAWFEIHADRAVCLPVPFNLVAAAGRSFWLFLKHGRKEVRINPRAAYEQGRREAMAEREAR